MVGVWWSFWQTRTTVSLCELATTRLLQPRPCGSRNRQPNITIYRTHDAQKPCVDKTTRQTKAGHFIPQQRLLSCEEPDRAIASASASASHRGVRVGLVGNFQYFARRKPPPLGLVTVTTEGLRPKAQGAAVTRTARARPRRRIRLARAASGLGAGASRGGLAYPWALGWSKRLRHGGL